MDHRTRDGWVVKVLELLDAFVQHHLRLELLCSLVHHLQASALSNAPGLPGMFYIANSKIPIFKDIVPPADMYCSEYIINRVLTQSGNQMSSSGEYESLRGAVS